MSWARRSIDNTYEFRAPRQMQRPMLLMASALLTAFFVALLQWMPSTAAPIYEPEPIVMVAATADCTIPTAGTKTLLSLHVLAFDNTAENDEFGLAENYATTVDALVAATAANEQSRVVILADLPTASDTHIIVATDGVATTLNCLLDETGTLTDSISEYDVTNGATLGQFMLWARTIYPATRTTFSFVGHGTPVAPYTEPGIAEWLTTPTTPTVPSGRSSNTLTPLPSSLKVHPNFSDSHAPAAGQTGLITPFAIRTALQIGTQDGSNPIDVLDLLHCFAGSIEELYEVAGDFTQDQLYAHFTVATSSYAFFDPLMPGAVLELVETHLHSAENLAWKFAYVYDQYHPADGHPHVIMSIDNSNLPLLYDDYATLSAELLAEFDADPVATANRLDQIYLRSRKFDSSYCEADWELAAPDALSNLKDIAAQMRYGPANFQHNPTIVATANALMTDHIYQVISQQYAADGIPWFADGVTEAWDMESFRGIAMFTPMMAREVDGADYMPWQSLWYTHTQVYTVAENTVVTNPHPFAFITPNAPGVKTWADVIARYQSVRNLRPGVDLPTAYCGSDLLGYDSVLADIEIVDPSGPVVMDDGSVIEYGVGLENLYGTTATGVVVSWTLAAELTFVESEPAGICSADGQIVTCAVGDVSSAETSARGQRPVEIRELSIKVTTDPGTDATLSSVVTVNAATHDPIVRSETTTVTTRINAAPTAVTLVGSAEAQSAGALPLAAALLTTFTFICVVNRIRDAHFN